MLRMLEAQAPAKQNAGDTISTLSGRLVNATLLEDRRAAVLGLRSFVKQYPASVASGALRGLISSLTKDAEDVDTLKVTLETLLMLFNPNDDSPEASEDIALWLADEFTQRQDNITLLLDLLDKPDFYPRLYSLQLISAISTARPERTQECILSAPLGTTRLVEVLDDARDAIRNVALLLLADLTSSSVELQKLVAFENAFDRIFKLISSEGSLALGGVVVQDCIALLANLLRSNASNQSLFRETGYVSHLGDLLPGGRQSKNLDDNDWRDPQGIKNLWGLLALLRVFLVRGSKGTQNNQDEFEKRGLLQKVLALGFNKDADVPIRAEALNTCADIVRANPKLQERFAQLQVAPVLESRVNGQIGQQVNGFGNVYVIEGLLDITLAVHSIEMLDVRQAACECIQAYFFGHSQIQQHFLGRAIEGHHSGQDEHANILSILISGGQTEHLLDPYQLWFASVLMFHLTYENPATKHQLISVVEGDIESGEETVSCIQAITANLISGLQRAEDDRISVGYLMLLCGWLFDDPDAINDLLSEGSNVPALVQITSSRVAGDQTILQGLCAVLLGIMYEFSTKDSPIPRRTLQGILTSGLGREQYIHKISQLRQHPFLRDSDVLPHGSPPLDNTFVDFLKDNYSRLIRAIDKDPRLEVPRSLDGVDRDVLDSLRNQLQDRDNSLRKAESELLTLSSELEQAQAEHRKLQEMSSAEVNRIKSINEALHEGHDTDLKNLESAHRAAMDDLHDQHQQRIQDITAQLEQAQAKATEGVESVKQRSDAEIVRLNSSKQNLERLLQQCREELSSAQQELREDADKLRQYSHELESLRTANDQLAGTVAQKGAELTRARDAQYDVEERLTQQSTEIVQLKERIKHQEGELIHLRQKLDEQEANLHRVNEDQNASRKEVEQQNALLAQKVESLKDKEGQLAEKETARSATQTELDDLLIILADLEEKRGRDKKRLKALGEAVSDVEDGEEEDGDDDADENEVNGKEGSDHEAVG